MEEAIKNVYYGNLLTESDLRSFIEDLGNPDMAKECIVDNLVDLLSDSIEEIASDLMEVIKNFS